jgi:hypothetical protein
MSEDPMMREGLSYHLAEGEPSGKRPSVAEDQYRIRFL